MSSVLKWLLLALAAVWCIGWLGCTVYMCFFGPGSGDKKRGQQNRFLGTLIMNAFLWPVVWLIARMHRRARRFEKDVETGKRPQWLQRDEGERPDIERTLANGTQFSASPVDGSSRPTLIQADCEGGVPPESVECRVRKVAPEEGEPSEWKPMRLKRQAPDPDDEDQDESEFYETRFELGRGKYRADFRVRVRGKEPEEFGSITLVVASEEDFDI
jgi:hypothetical protein